MNVVATRKSEGCIVVQTTGAEYVVDTRPGAGSIECRQLLGTKRRVATVGLNVSLEYLDIESQTPDRTILHQLRGMDYRSLTLVVHRDSLLELSSLVPLTVTVQVAGASESPGFPEYVAQKTGSFFFADRFGGIGLYPCSAGRATGVGRASGATDVEVVRSGDGGTRVSFRLERSSTLLVSVFPPRPFPEEQYRSDGILHHGSIGPWVVPPFPDPEYLERASEHCSVLVLHEGLWQGKLSRAGETIRTPEDIYNEAAFTTCSFVPIDEAALRRTVGHAHELGMRVIPYMSPLYSLAMGPEFLSAVDRVLDEYRFDGVYYDGVASDILDAYAIMRASRDLLEDRLLYVHSTSGPLESRIITCPFADTYADYVLRAEHAARLGPEELRFVISGYNTSSAVGVLCYYDLPLDTMRSLIPACLEHRVRFYLGSPETERERLLLEEYFPLLARGE